MRRIGQRLKEIRGDISQKDFANQFGFSLSKYQRIEKGMTSPDADFLKEVLSKYPEISIHWLVLGKGKKDEKVVGPVDVELLGKIIASVDDLLKKHDIKSNKLDNQRKASIISLLYELFVLRKREGRLEIDRDTVNEYLKVAISTNSGGPDGH